MAPVNMHEAKSRLSQLVDAIESGREREVVIARNGKPAAKLVSIGIEHHPVRLGLAKGKYVIPDDINRDEAEIIRLFEGSDDFRADAA